MNNLIKTIGFLVLMGCAYCAVYYNVPIAMYAMNSGLKIGLPALHCFACSNASLDAINTELENAKARVTIEDVYAYGYGKPFEEAPWDGDTGQKFRDMTTATGYFQNILKAKGVRDSGSYFLTSINSAKSFGFTLVAAVHRESVNPMAVNQLDPSNQNPLTCVDPSHDQPYRYNCKAKSLDTVYEWAALSNECFEKQGQQAIFLALAVNTVLGKTPKPDYWDAQKKWVAGDYLSVVNTQGEMVCQGMGIEKEEVQHKDGFYKNIFKD